ncbi:extensin family protein [Pontixanthobacter sp. CEM42]|uniref:extensin family protein n=1 Tax=Pontixanthobacter sp. CEM42 TaxID=2792077 RepID=UPI001AE0833F|nr:extensin family protein [Pontixanthobacter sp. CEM42]
MVRNALLIAASALLGGCSLLPGSDRSDPPRSTQSANMPVSGEARQCLAQLDRTGSRYSPLPDRTLGQGCTNFNTVRLSDLRGDTANFALANLGPVTCPTANAFAGWARYGVDRAARQILGSPLLRIETMGSYSCRNVAGSNRRSAHSRAEAIDVAAFVLADGRRVSVLGDWNAGSAEEREFLRIVRGSACKRFGTVLSPDYNADHRDHFHLEVGSSDFCR